MEAKRIIEQEHRSLAAVLHGLLSTVREIRYMRSEPDFILLAAMLEYVDTFIDRFHHPKEDRYLFERLRVRCPGASQLLDRLHEEHAMGAAKIRELRAALRRYEACGHPEFGDFATLAAAYAAFHWSHMSTEENEVLPLAQRHLTVADWQLIDDAFAGNSDPLLGTEPKQGYESLFQRIVERAPPPIGVGSRP